MFDTTANNTGILNGVYHIFEQKSGRNILYITCRHYTYEIVLQGDFSKVKLIASTGPDIILFRKCQK